MVNSRVLVAARSILEQALYGNAVPIRKTSKPMFEAPNSLKFGDRIARDGNQNVPHSLQMLVQTTRSA